jgi:hypothetical protein
VRRRRNQFNPGAAQLVFQALSNPLARAHWAGAEGQAFLSRQSSNSLVFEEDGNGEAFVYLLVKRHRWQTDAECKNINEAIPITFRDVGWLVSR